MSLKTRVAPAPTLWLELTPRCNLSCTFCYNPWRPKPKKGHPFQSDPATLLAAVARLLHRTSFEYVALSGGEPLLYPEIRALVEALTELGQRTILTTNGRIATRARLTPLARAGLQGIQIPLLAVTPELHDRLSGRRSWDRAIMAIVDSRELGLAVGVTFVATSENLGELPEVVGLLGHLGVPDLVVNHVHLTGAGATRQDLSITDAQFAQAIDAAEDVAATAGISVTALGHNRLPNEQQPRAWGRLALDPATHLKFCNQSEQTVGAVCDLSDQELDTMLHDVRVGDLRRLSQRTDNCSCLRNAALN